jgi:hypothetical protein
MLLFLIRTEYQHEKHAHKETTQAELLDVNKGIILELHQQTDQKALFRSQLKFTPKHVLADLFKILHTLEHADGK